MGRFDKFETSFKHSVTDKGSGWEWACSRQQAIKPARSLLTDLTPSRASPLPQSFVVNTGTEYTLQTCGSGLAREGVSSVNSSLAERTLSRASFAPALVLFFQLECVR
ncbi:hypothetical protein C2E19_19485 [Pseudomonas sp. DTU12.3]|nr:hypothetical protein C2E19_19485 [Pseudomonas sp. DTU12.3]